MIKQHAYCRFEAFTQNWTTSTLFTNLNNILSTSLLLVLALFVVCATTYAQSNTARSQALGGCGVVLLRGTDALLANPANCRIDTSSSLQLRFVAFNLLGGSSTLNVADVRQYFGRSTDTNTRNLPNVLSNKERDLMFDKLSGTSISSDVCIQILGACLSVDESTTLGMSMTSNFQMLTTLPCNLTALVNGTVGKESVNLSNSRASLLAYNALQVSCAKTLMTSIGPGLQTTLTAGLSIKRIEGISYAELMSGSSIKIQPYTPQGWDSTSNLDLEIALQSQSSSSFSSPRLSIETMLPHLSGANTGYGIDLGLNYETSTEFLRSSFSLAVTDIGSILWNDARIDVLNTKDTIASALSLDESYLDHFEQQITHQNVRSNLPTKLRLGAAFSFAQVFQSSEQLSLMCEYLQGLNTQGNNTLRPRVACGFELRQRGFRPTLRLGTHVGGVDGWSLSAGLGARLFNTLSLDLAIGTLESLLYPSKATWMNIAFSSHIDL